jgi:hypothetical protein
MLDPGGNGGGQGGESRHKRSSQGQKVGKVGGSGQTKFCQEASQTSKGEREETFRPLNLESGEKGASTRKECSKGEASKDSVQVVEQLRSTFGSSKSSEEEEENLEIANISKKLIKISK